MTEIQTPPGTDEVKADTQKPPETQPPAQPQVDYEKKFAESTRENQILQAKLATQEKERQESTNEPTDSELRAAFPEWDSLSDFEKATARRSLNAERVAAGAARKVDDLTADRSWSTGIELAISANDDLQGKEQAFRQFASRPQYRGAPMDLIVAAFLGKQSPQPTPNPTPKPGLETVNGGPRTPDKPKLLSSAELKALRESDEKQYLIYIRTHDVSEIAE